jgi:hypothetical protein
MKQRPLVGVHVTGLPKLNSMGVALIRCKLRGLPRVLDRS